MKEYIWELKETEKRSWAAFESPDGYWRAEIKQDGCIEFYHSFNAPVSAETCETIMQRLIDQIHICNIDDAIARLQALKEVAKGFFGDSWE